jgi:maintenance of morphology protein 1
MLPNFTLDLKSTSLLGSRAKLADVPKLHELIDNQIRRAIIRWGTLKIVLPGLSNVDDVREVERKFTLDRL